MLISKLTTPRTNQLINKRSPQQRGLPDWKRWEKPFQLPLKARQVSVLGGWREKGEDAGGLGMYLTSQNRHHLSMEEQDT